jgi:hypothetical protein
MGKAPQVAFSSQEKTPSPSNLRERVTPLFYQVARVSDIAGLSAVGNWML